jgi:hypothetical protein
MAVARFTVVGMVLLAGVAAAAQSPALKDEQAKRSYALGMAVGNQLRSESVEVDSDLYRQGLKDALSGGKTLLTEAESRAALHRLQLELKRAPQRDKLAAAAAAGAIEVSFKLDPRVTKSLYMGERWVSGPAFSSASVPEGEAITVEARARRPRAGVAGKIGPTWIASDPEMVTITPVQGDYVKLTVRRAGESTVTVKHGGLSTAFAVKTVRQAGHWRVDLSKAQLPPAPAAVTAAAGTPADRREK